MRTITILLSASLFFLAAADAMAALPAKVTPLGPGYLRDHAQTRGFMLGRPVKARPTPDGKAVLFLRSVARTPRLHLYEFDVAGKATRELLSPETLMKGAAESLSPEEKARRERQRVSASGFTDYQLSEDGRLVLISLSGKLYVFDRSTAAVKELATGNGTLIDPKFSPDGKHVSYVLDYDVYVYELATGKQRAVTTGGTAARTHGLAEFVAQEEMDRYTGYWWSPDSRFLAYEEADAGGVETWYVADPKFPENKPHPTYYPRPGKANVKVRAGIVPVGGGLTVWIDWDHNKYEYLAQVRWDRHGPLTVTVQDRLQHELLLLKADPATGTTMPLLSEKDPAWVNLRQDVPRWLEGGKGFVWIGEDAGGPRLERRDARGKLDDVLLSGPGKVDQVLAVDEKADLVYFLSSEDVSATTLYRQSLFSHGGAGAQAVLGSSVQGLLTATFSKNDSLFVATFTSPAAMPRTTVYSRQGAPLGDLPSVAETPSFQPNIVIPRLSPASPAAYAVAIVRPRNFDPSKKYPVLVDVYGGPKHQVVLAGMRNWLLPQWLADQGFIVVAIDNRGTPGRGRAWERAIYQKFGSVPLQDQANGLRELARQHPEMDLERVGITGWSFGGYMSALAVLRRPDVFKAAVAGAPVTDWEDYDTHYTERYLGLPQQSPQAYKEASLLTYASDLKRPLLLVHGTADDNVYFRHTLKLADALFRAGKDFEVLPLSGLTHIVPDPVVMENLYGRIARFFRKHLGEPAGKGGGS